jgi:hypothetical protein
MSMIKKHTIAIALMLAPTLLFSNLTDIAIAKVDNTDIAVPIVKRVQLLSVWAILNTR